MATEAEIERLFEALPAETAITYKGERDEIFAPENVQLFAPQIDIEEQRKQWFKDAETQEREEFPMPSEERRKQDSLNTNVLASDPHTKEGTVFIPSRKSNTKG